MSGIQLKNQNQANEGVLNVSATVPPHAPTSSAVIARYVAPGNGKVFLVVSVAVAGAVGNSVDFKQVVRLRNADFPGSGTTIVTNDAIIFNATTGAVDTSVAGTIKQAAFLASAAPVLKGQVVDVHYSETGTIGTATRATFNIVGVIFEAGQHMDSRFNQ
jgi:hypothetical protein